MEDNKTRCSLCLSPKVLNSGGVGYIEYMNGRLPICYDCCAITDRRDMIIDGKATMYLNWNGDGTKSVSNWPCSLKIKCFSQSKSTTTWGHERTDVWFKGPDGHTWWGYHIGDSHQIIKVKRIKSGIWS